FNTKIESLLNLGNGALTYPSEITNLDGLKIHYIDVGQGDATVIEFPDGKELLIDAGPADSDNALIDYINTYVFTDGEDTNFEYVLLTHSDEDHVGGMISIFENFTATNIFRPKIFSDIENNVPSGLKIISTIVYRNYITAIENAQNSYGANILFADAGERIPFITEPYTDYEIIFYTPTEDYYADVNNYSPIIVLTYKDKKFMFTGDSDESIEGEFLSATSSFGDIDVLKIGHHGSSTSTSQELLNEISPEYAVISVGEDNNYGHPSDYVLDRLSGIGMLSANIFRTDTQSNILAYVSINGVLQFYTYQKTNAYEYVTWWQIVVMLIGFSAVIIFSRNKRAIT
ncbi:MAG: MBL fold metallo-hydrolase, partial [Clostridia bacterium]|nr:MBL fold metallo-hydrolase [Clostridia bacterium]